MLPSRNLRLFLLASFLCLTGAMTAVAMPVLPAISSPDSGEQHTGKVVLVELVTPDIDAAEKFYGGLFGWKFKDIKDDRYEYAEASLNGHPVAGLIHRTIQAGEKKQPAWLTFFSTKNVDAVKDAAISNGAKLLFGPKDIPNRGREAVFTDPQGAVFAALTSSSEDPSDVLAAPGEWIWSSLHTTDPGMDAAFYQKLFDYEVYDVSSPDEVGHFLLAAEGYSRASVNTLPARKGESNHPHWINYIRVRDVSRMAAKVAKLGGKILIEPHVDRHGGKIAVVADPQGAPFGLIEWAADENKAGAQ